MADDHDEADDERAIELSSISAIYPELLVDPSEPFSATIEIPVEPVEPLAIYFPPLTDGAVPSGLPTPPGSNDRDRDLASQLPRPQHSEELHTLSHLPPLQLRVHLPAEYPANKPPVLSLSTDVSWLPQEILRKLEGQGRNLWEEMGHSQVLFAYIDYLREAAENGFGRASSKTNPLTMSSDLKIILLDYDIKAKLERFERATFECGVCLEPKKGVVCHRMSLCGHVFCIECLQDFFNNCITEGDVSSVKCIAPQCGQDEDAQLSEKLPSGYRKRRKRDKTLGPSELLQIPLEQHIVQRYVMLKRKNALESDPTTVYCPRQWCQGPARSKKTEALDRNLDIDSDEEAENPSDAPLRAAERLAICADCTFAFCKVCKASWHGEFIICDPQRKAKLTAEEEASEEYVRLHTSPCPTCNARCQKTHGCNHMICFKCNTHFCYLCSSWLDDGNPYEHFNNPKKSCYMRLWELEGGDEAGIGQGFGGGFGVVNDDDDGDEDMAMGLFGQHGNPLADLDDVDSEDEIERPRAPAAPPERNHPNRHAQNAAVRPPPARVQAAIARRAAAAPVQANHVHEDRVQLERRAPPPGPALARVLPPHRLMQLMRRRPIEGIQQALDIIQNDQEDEWDSDELGNDSDEDNDDFWQIPFRR
ncbi:MAG: hypothetical protein Q9201_002688 [Fulgogasparrea decipioides]